ncbi:MAG TPA: hypothetical protein VIY56_15580, partial [Vicinamibacterales bacterium]
MRSVAGGWVISMTAVWLHAAPPQAPQGPAAVETPVTAKAALDQYCLTCHSARAKAGGLSLADLDPARVAPHAEVWEKVVRKLKAGAM